MKACIMWTAKIRENGAIIGYWAKGGETMNGRLTGVETRLPGVENRMTGFETRLTGVENRVARVETRLGGLQWMVCGIYAVLTIVGAPSLWLLLRVAVKVGAVTL